MGRDFAPNAYRDTRFKMVSASTLKILTKLYLLLVQLMLVMQDMTTNRILVFASLGIFCVPPTPMIKLGIV